MTLPPCPYCGSKAKRMRYRQLLRVYCPNSGCSAAPHATDTKLYAVREKWTALSNHVHKAGRNPKCD